jgi:hypothetical protein
VSLGTGPAVLFAAAALAFLLPFGTVSCEGETVSFTGLELATMRVPADPAPAPEADGDLADEVEAEGGSYALLALVLVIGGLVSAVLQGRGGGFAFGAGFALFVLLINVGETEPDVNARGGYWVALGSVAGAGAIRGSASLRTRRLRRDSGEPAPPVESPGRRFARRTLYVAAAIGVLVIGDALAPSPS